MQITSQGTGAGDGWQLVAEFPDAELPAGTNRDGAFIVSGMLSNAVAGGASSALLEVGATVAGRAIPYRVARTRAVNGQILGTRGIPFQFILVFESGGSLGAYSPTGAERLQIVARVSRNGDPPTISTSFDIVATSITFWDLDRLGSANWEHYSQTFVSTSLNANSSGIGTVGSPSAYFPIGVSENYLVYSAVEYRPGSNLEAPTIRVSQDIGGTAGQLFDIGGTRRTGSTNADYLSMGGMRVLVVDGSTTRLVLQGVDGHDGGDRTTVHRADFFSVRLGQLAASHVLQKANTDGTREKILSDHDAATPGRLQWEPTLANVTGNMIFTGYLRAPETGTQPRSWTHFLLFGTRAVYWSERYLIGGPDGSCGVVAMGRLPAFNPQDPRSYQLAASNPAEASAASTYFAEDQCVVAFVFEMDASVFLKTGRPADPSTILVIPGRETSLGLADVSVLPYEPTDYSFVDDVGEPFDIESPMGQRVTWPRFAKPRTIHTLPFLLKESERNTLLSFFETAPGRVFAWTPPDAGGAQKMFRVVGDIAETMQDAGRGPGTDSVLWSIAVPVVELVWYGSA